MKVSLSSGRKCSNNCFAKSVFNRIYIPSDQLQELVVFLGSPIRCNDIKHKSLQFKLCANVSNKSVNIDEFLLLMANSIEKLECLIISESLLVI